MTVDSILNALILPAIFLALAILIYTKAKDPIDKFFSWVGDKIRGDDKADEKYEGSYDIDYRPAGTYEYNEDI